MSYIKKLQSKSEDSRKQILAVSMLLSMSLVVMIWVYGLSDLFTPKTNAETARANNEMKPFKVFANSITDTYENITASVGKISSKKDTKIEVAEPAQKQIDLIQVEKVTNQ